MKTPALDYVRSAEAGDVLLAQIAEAGLPAPYPELLFAPPRKWRFDYAWPTEMLAVEIEGGTWARGRHTSGAGFTKDCEKYAEAMCLGWRVLRVTTGQVHDKQAIGWIERLVK